MKKISIDPITRLEGHGRIDLFINDQGTVENAYLVIPELRGFEKFCEGKHVEELPRITAKICGVCPEAHHMASTKACDAVFGVTIPPAAKKLRELFYCAHMIHSHIAHFYALAAPDFIVGSEAPASERNILGVVARVGADIGKEVIRHRAMAQDIQSMIAGRATYPVCGLPGGCSKAITEAERASIAEKAASCVQFAGFSLKVFNDVILSNPKFTDTIKSKDIFYNETYYMGTVDERNRLNFYDGLQRVVAPDGKEIFKFSAPKYHEVFSERMEPWSYMKFPYLKSIGWKGFVDGPDSGVVRVAPLARLNASAGMATPLAHEEYERMYALFGGKPVHHTLAFHWARLIELMYAAERVQELSKDPEITSPDVRVIPTGTPSEGVGIVEAPRGTLVHHYKTDANGVVTGVNLVVATVFNNPAMNISVAKAARALIKNGTVSDELLNKVEMAFRAYDPCMSCATHSLPGSMPLIVTFKNLRGETIKTLRRDA